MSKYIYLLSSQHFQKIGIATNIKRRVDALQTGNPFVIRVLAYWGTDTPGKTETILHQYYSIWHIRGEWFQIPFRELEQLVLVRGLDEWSLLVLEPRLKVRADYANNLINPKGLT